MTSCTVTNCSTLFVWNTVHIAFMLNARSNEKDCKTLKPSEIVPIEANTIAPCLQRHNNVRYVTKDHTHDNSKAVPRVVSTTGNLPPGANTVQTHLKVERYFVLAR